VSSTPKRPSDQHDRLGIDLADQLGDVLAAAVLVIALVGDLRLALAAGVEGDDAVLAGEGRELGLKDPARHGPARHEDDCMFVLRARQQIVQPDPVRGDEGAIDRLGRGRAGQGEEQGDSQPSQGSASISAAPLETAAAFHPVPPP
jgi:hypothetical protein